MEPQSRERLVRDYSTDGMFASPGKKHVSPARIRYNSPPVVHRTASYEQPSYEKPSYQRPPSRQDEDDRRLDFGLDSVDERSTYEPSISTQVTNPTSVSSGTARLADFFSPQVFEIVLRNPTTAHQFKKFAQTRLCAENIEFLEKVIMLSAAATCY